MAIFNFSQSGQFGSTYFTLETVRNSDGFYDSSSFPNARGYYSNFTNVSESHLVTSSYIFAEVIPPGVSSFEFNPSDSAMPTGSFYFRGTGDMTVTVDTYSGSYALTQQQLYGQGLLDTFPLTPVPNFQARVSANSGSYEALSCQNAILADIGTRLLSSASLLVTPNGYTEGVLFSTLPNSSSGDLTVTRATTATRVNSDGLVELVPYNLLTYSQTFSNVIWLKIQATISSNIATAPNGTNTASKLVENTANDGHHIYQNALANGVNTFSFYAKKGERTFVYAYADSVGQGKCFNLTSGTLGVNIIAAPLNATIESVGNDWFRCTITLSIASASALRIGLCSADGTFSYLGNGTSGAFIWGAQLNQGTSALDYQATETRLNIPRLDYSNGSCPSILVEPQRTNLFTYSEQFDNGVWRKASATITTNATIAPDGTLTADKAIATNTVNATRAVMQDFTPILDSTYNVSVYVKAAEYTKFTICEIGNGRFGASFDLVAETSTSLGGLSYVSSLITNEGNGWYKCSIVATGSPVGWAVGFMGYPDGATLYTSGVQYAGDGVSGVFIWGAQLEAGAYATSYIPTTSATVTRNADVISKTGISSLIGQTEGVIFIDYYASAQNQDGESFAYLFLGGDSTNNIQIYNLGITLHWFIRNASGEIIRQTANQTLVAGSRYKIALAYKSGEYALYINGVQKRTSTNSSAPPAMSQFNLNAEDFGASAAKVKNEFNAVAFWPTRLTNDQLTALTTI